MTKAVYEVVRHDGGWAYRMGSTFSETYSSEGLAHNAAERAAREQRTPGETTAIAYETPKGEWREETVRGNDRPSAEVKD